MDPLLVLLAVLVLAPIAASRWPRLVGLPSLFGRKDAHYPDGLTLFVAGTLSGIGIIRMLAIGALGTLSAPRLLSGEDVASGYLNDALAGLVVHNPDSTEQTVAARRQAAHALISPRTAPDMGLRVELHRIVRGLAASAVDDAAARGLMRSTTTLRRMLLAAAGAELLIFAVTDLWTSQNLLICLAIGAGTAALCAYHIDARTVAGVHAADDLRRAGDRLRRAVAEAGSLDAMSVRTLVPEARNAEELGLWAMAAGCHSPESEAAVRELWLLAGTSLSDGGRMPADLMRHPGVQMGFMDQMVYAYVRLARLLIWPVRALWQSIAGKRTEARSPLLW